MPRIKSQREQQEVSDHELLQKMSTTLYGDGNGNKGMESQVSEMHEFFMGARFAGKLIVGIIILLGTIATWLTPLGSFLKHIFYNSN